MDKPDANKPSLEVELATGAIGVGLWLIICLTCCCAVFWPVFGLFLARLTCNKHCMYEPAKQKATTNKKNS